MLLFVKVKEISKCVVLGQASGTINHNKQKAHLYAFITVWVKSKTMPRDPVCGVVLDKEISKFKINYEGEKYYFCSVKCKKKFKRNPRKFVK